MSKNRTNFVVVIVAVVVLVAWFALEKNLTLFNSDIQQSFTFNGSTKEKAPSENSKEKQIVQDFLNRFEELDLLDTTTWKTYTNKRFGFVLSYPASTYSISDSNYQNLVNNDSRVISAITLSKRTEENFPLLYIFLHTAEITPNYSENSYTKELYIDSNTTTAYLEIKGEMLYMDIPFSWHDPVGNTTSFQIEVGIHIASFDELSDTIIEELKTILSSIQHIPIESRYITERVEDTMYGGECGDIQLVYFNEKGIRRVVEESMGDLVAPIVKNHRSCNTSLRPLAFHEALGRLFFSTNIYEGGGLVGGSIYEYNIARRTLKRLRINDMRTDVEKLSPDGIHIASVSYEVLVGDENNFDTRFVLRAQEMKIFNLLTDTGRVVLNLNNEEETLVGNMDAYGPSPAFEWIDENTVQYDVFDATNVGPGSYGHSLKDTRLLQL